MHGYLQSLDIKGFVPLYMGHLTDLSGSEAKNDGEGDFDSRDTALAVSASEELINKGEDKAEDNVGCKAGRESPNAKEVRHIDAGGRDGTRPDPGVNCGQHPDKKTDYKPLDNAEDKTVQIAGPADACRPQESIDKAKYNTASKEKDEADGGVLFFREHGTEIPLHSHQVHRR